MKLDEVYKLQMRGNVDEAINKPQLEDVKSQKSSKSSNKEIIK